MTKKETKEVAKAGNTGFAIIDQPDAKQAMLAAFDQLGVTSDLLQRVKLPSGGMTAFMLDDLEGQTVHQHIDVILLCIKGRQKAWWAKALDEGGGGVPPSCTSTDGIHGFGVNTLADNVEPGKHLCSECPWGRFGSARSGGNGKDCKDFSMLFFFREGSRIPSVMQVPATSLKNLQNYVLRLIDAGKRYEGVVTRLALQGAQSQSGIQYSKLKVEFVKELAPDEAATMVAIAEDFMARVADFDTFDN